MEKISQVRITTGEGGGLPLTKWSAEVMTLELGEYKTNLLSLKLGTEQARKKKE